MIIQILQSMLKLNTYRVNPYILHGIKSPFDDQSASSWLRTSVNLLYNRSKGRIKNENPDTSAFHNHDEMTGRTKPGYPLIIYHADKEGKYVTCVNDGINLFDSLISGFNEPVKLNNEVFLSFSLVRTQECKVIVTENFSRYSISNWLPMNSEPHKAYLKKKLFDKILFLEEILMNNLCRDFGKYLNIELDGLKIQIEDIDQMKRSCMQYKGHDFIPFSFIFSANIILPDYIFLGNGKAFGYGKVIKV